MAKKRALKALDDAVLRAVLDAAARLLGEIVIVSDARANSRVDGRIGRVTDVFAQGTGIRARVMIFPKHRRTGNPDASRYMDSEPWTRAAHRTRDLIVIAPGLYRNYGIKPADLRK